MVVAFPRVTVPAFRLVLNKFVEDAVVEYKFVVVALPPTAVWKVRFVVEAITAPRVVV